VSLYGELRDAGNGAAYGGSAFGTYSATVRVRNGSSYRVSMRMEGAALAGSVSSSGWASYDLGNSAYWGGITSVRVGGAEVSSYVLSSESGTDYRNSMAPIPEPGALAMMLAGLGVLVGLQRRRRR
jgi:hypothetical protein